MIRSSDQTDQLATALAQFQSEMRSVPKTHRATVPTKSGSEYSYVYADLADTVEAAAPLLSARGLSVTQAPGWVDGTDVLTTRVMHSSGQWVEGTMRLFLSKEDPQSHGSALTYARRYAYCAALGIVADEDDDGASATRRAASSAHQVPRGSVRRAPSRPPHDPETGELRQANAKGASEAQLRFLAKLGARRGLSDDGLVTFASATSGREISSLADLSTAEASAAIDALQVVDAE